MSKSGGEVTSDRGSASGAESYFPPRLLLKTPQALSFFPLKMPNSERRVGWKVGHVRKEPLGAHR